MIVPTDGNRRLFIYEKKPNVLLKSHSNGGPLLLAKKLEYSFSQLKLSACISERLFLLVSAVVPNILFKL